MDIGPFIYMFYNGYWALCPSKELTYDELDNRFRQITLQRNALACTCVVIVVQSLQWPCFLHKKILPAVNMMTYSDQINLIKILEGNSQQNL